MITKKKNSDGKRSKAGASRLNKIKNKPVRKPSSDQETPSVKDDGALLAEAERRELNTPLWAVNLERENEHEK
jgi:hypothetical protein